MSETPEYDVREILKRAMENGQDDIVWLCTSWAGMAKDNKILAETINGLVAAQQVLMENADHITLTAAVLAMQKAKNELKASE